MAIRFLKMSFYLVLCLIGLLATSGAQKKSKSARAKKPAAATANSPSTTDSALPYRDPNLSIDDRVADLLSRMSVEEKVEQIAGSRERDTHVIDPTGTFTDDKAREWLSRWGDPEFQFSPKDGAILRNAVQRYLKEKTRLGIPQLFMGESLHGYMEYGSTSFPQAIGLASTFDPDLVKQVFTAAGEEAGKDHGRRWIAAFVAGLAYLILAAFSAALVTVVAAAPAGLLEAVAGLALLGTLASAISSALAVAEERVPACITFLLAASGISFAGVGAAFWALAGGILVRWLLKDREPLTPSHK